ncbi:MAG TPA: PDZ domain-containing protein [Pyrinomonadaceae bacterium]|nr:PDZ domain-containing protein [Pyrinomonadaceae bacterium]
MKRKALFAAFSLALLSFASANAPAQDVTHAAPAAPVTAPAPPADIGAPAAPVAPAVAAAPADIPSAPHADVVAPALPADTYAPPAQAAPAAPVRPAAPADAPEPQIGFSETLFDDGNYLGVRVEELTRENAKAYGLTGEPRGVGVTQVLKGSPAERAGVRERDVIVRFDGEAVTSLRKLTRLITESSPEHTARVTVLRGGSEQELSVTLARRELLAPAAAGDMMGRFDLGEVKRLGEDWARSGGEWKLKADEWGRGFQGFEGDGPGAFVLASSRRIGVTTTALGKQLADYFGVSHGVLVSSVEQGSPADKAGLKAGDVLTEADGRKLDDASDLVRALGAKDEGEVTLTFVRDKQRRTVRVTPEKRQTPRGLFINPGGVRVATPVASVVAPRFSMIPRAAAVPGFVGTPRLLREDPDFITPPALLGPPHTPATPRVRVEPRVRVAPRVTVVEPGRIL